MKKPTLLSDVIDDLDLTAKQWNEFNRLIDIEFDGGYGVVAVAYVYMRSKNTDGRKFKEKSNYYYEGVRFERAGYGWLSPIGKYRDGETKYRLEFTEETLERLNTLFDMVRL